MTLGQLVRNCHRQWFSVLLPSTADTPLCGNCTICLLSAFDTWPSLLACCHCGVKLFVDPMRWHMIFFWEDDGLFRKWVVVDGVSHQSHVPLGLPSVEYDSYTTGHGQCLGRERKANLDASTV